MKYEREIITPIGHYVGVCKGEFLPTPDGSIGINKDVETMLTNFRKEMNDRMAAAVVRGFNPFIEEFFSNREPLSIDDFTDETFVKDCKIVANGCSPYTPSFLKALYGYVFENGYGSFEILNHSIINYNSVIRLINSGYTLIVYNPTSPIPESDKWLLWDGNRVIDFDFSSINTENKAIALKSYIWIDRSSSLKNKCKLMGKYISFLNIMSNESLKVSVKDVMTFKNSLSDLSSASKAVYSNSVLDFVRYIKTVFEADVSQLTLDAFSSENTKSKPFKDSYSSEQMQQIFAGMDAKIANAKGGMHDYYALAKLMTQIVNETPVRGENVQNLTLSCIEKAPETNHYYLHYNPKNFAEDTIPLIPEVKSLFDQVIQLTDKYRTPGIDKSNYIFIYRRARGNNIDIVSASRTSQFINDVCKQLELPTLGLAGVRNRFMEKVTRAVGAKGQVSKSVIEAASRHSANVHFQNYVDMDINQICLNMYGITVGATDLKGVVSTTNPEATRSNTVLNGRGHCTVASCEDKTLCDCLMCRRFKTTPDCIPFFEKEIKALEMRIYNSTMEEERKFLIAMKTLNLKYLVALYERQKEMIDNADNH